MRPCRFATFQSSSAFLKLTTSWGLSPQVLSQRTQNSRRMRQILKRQAVLKSDSKTVLHPTGDCVLSQTTSTIMCLCVLCVRLLSSCVSSTGVPESRLNLISGASRPFSSARSHSTLHSAPLLGFRHISQRLTYVPEYSRRRVTSSAFIDRRAPHNTSNAASRMFIAQRPSLNFKLIPPRYCGN